MSLNIDTLKSAIGAHRGLAVANRFELIIPGIDGQTTTIFCQTTSIPGRTIVTQEFQNQTVMETMPFLYEDEDITLTFMLTNDYFIYDYFIEWMNSVINTDKYYAGYKRDYSRSVILRHLDKTDAPIAEFELIEAFPKNVTSIELSSTNENQISIFSSTISYKTFYYTNLSN